MRLGIYGGSFDPIHHGPLILARTAAEQLNLHRVIFIPANISPHKMESVPTTAEDRLSMLRLALEGEEILESSDEELRRPPPSYTVDTLRQLSSAHPKAELILLVGADNVEKFSTWHEAETIQKLAEIAVLDRPSGKKEHPWPVVHGLVDISSTDIRCRVSVGKSIRYLTPRPVCDYISAKGLYLTSDI